MKRILLLTAILFYCATTFFAQEFNLSRFTNSSGLPQNYVYTVAQDRDGFVWIGMAEGLSKYDGIKFTNYTTRDSLADNYVSHLIMDIDGKLWCGHGNGQFSYYDGYKFHKMPIVEEMSAPIKDMCIDDKGNVWAVEQNMGLVKITPDHQIVTYFDEEKFGNPVFTSVVAVNSMSLFVGTDEGLLSVKVDIDGKVLAPRNIDGIDNGVNKIVPRRDGAGYWIATSGGGIYTCTVSGEVKQIKQCSESCTDEGNMNYDIRSLYEDANGDLYLGTWGDGMKEWKRREQSNDYVESLSLNEENGLGNNFVADITVDREGIFWFATYGGGVAAWVNNFFARYSIANIGFVRNKITTAQIDGQRLWLGLNEGVISLDAQCINNFEYFDTSMGMPAQTEISSIVIDKERGQQYVGTRGRGVYVRHNSENHYRPLDMGLSQQNLRMINGMVLSDSLLYMATQGGLVAYNITTATAEVYNTNNGLPHNNINFVYIDDEGQLWLGPKDSGIALKTNSEFEIHRLANVPVDVASMTVDRRGRFWLATVNNGVLCSSNDSVISITTIDGLEKNYCYGIARDNNEHIWVCHQPGLSCIDLNTGNIRTYSLNQGMNYEFDCVVPDKNGDLWFSSSSGVVHYISMYDKRNSVPPVINLTNITISDKYHDVNKPIDLPYPYDGNVDKLEFDFVGICMKDPKNVSYEYWLQMGEDDKDERWMSLGTQNHKEFDFLPEGDYILNVRAFNSNGIVCEKPLRISIHIDKPFWKTWWFPILAVVAVMFGFRQFSKWRERKLLKRQKELQDEVNRQTKEISDQKNEIERKNTDIMDSINYANLIQTSVLPSQDGLKDYPFADAFILYLPRDIVSGDFYWFTKHEDHVIICCGDCTGHGVHGAFLTMIGSTILNDAAHDPSMLTPCKLLDKLDREIKATLNKNVATEEKRDGMDCAIIDINLSNYEVTSAAARRPVNFIIKGELVTVKGTRRGIGEPRTANEFVETITQLHKGDYIYMSSDGFTDQMGGADNDDDVIKFSTKRYNEMLMKLYENPMHEQKEEMARILKNWAGHYERVDDVIVMGIKL